MTRHDPFVRIRHMVEHAREAVEMTHGRSREDLNLDRQLNLALVRLPEIVGEAAARVPDDFRRQYPNVPWRDIADLRNRLIHGYDSINFDILWQIMQQDIPVLLANLERILDQET